MAGSAGVQHRRPGPARAGMVALGGCIALAATSMALPALLPHPPARVHRELAHYVDVASNTSLPAWTATVLLLAAALASGVAGVAGRIGRVRGSWCWFAAAAVLAVASLDEHTELYERLGTLAVAVTALTGFPYTVRAAGAVAGIAVATVLALLAIRAPTRTRWLLLAGAPLLLGGAAAGALALQLPAGGAGYVLVVHGGWLGRAVGAVLLAAAACSAVAVTRHPTGVRLRHRSAGSGTAPAAPSEPAPEPVNESAPEPVNEPAPEPAGESTAERVGA